MICGDFNDTPYSYAYLTAKGDLCDAYRDGGFGPMKTCLLYTSMSHRDAVDKCCFGCHKNLVAVAKKHNNIGIQC